MAKDNQTLINDIRTYMELININLDELERREKNAVDKVEKIEEPETNEYGLTKEYMAMMKAKRMKRMFK